MNPSELNTRIRIRSKVTTKDADGFPKETWQDLEANTSEQQISRWAKWQWLHGSEFWEAKTVQSKVVAQVTMRYKAGITDKMQVVYKNKTYKIMPPIDNILEKNQIITFKVENVEGDS